MENTNVQEAPVETQAVDEKAQLTALLAEARNTKIVLEDFKAAVQNGSYQGHQMLGIAKGLAFLDAIINQNKAHIHNLQERTGK